MCLHPSGCLLKSRVEHSHVRITHMSVRRGGIYAAVPARPGRVPRPLPWGHQTNSSPSAFQYVVCVDGYTWVPLITWLAECATNKAISIQGK